MIDIAATVPAVLAAKKGVEPIVKEIREILTGDIVTFEGELFREVTLKVGRKKETRLVPIKYTARINALSIALGMGGIALALALVGFGLWWSQLRLHPLTGEEKGKLQLKHDQVVTTIRLQQETVDNIDMLINFIRTDFADDPTSEKTNKIILSDGRIRDIWQRTPVEDLIPALLALREELSAFLKEERTRLRNLKLKLSLGMGLEERKGFAISGPSLFG